jgi:hypothetical protein
MKIIISEDQSIRLRRRTQSLEKLLMYVISQNNPCNYYNAGHFYEKIMKDLSEIVRAHNEGVVLSTLEVLTYMREYRKDYIEKYFEDNQENCPPSA